MSGFPPWGPNNGLGIPRESEFTELLAAELQGCCRHQRSPVVAAEASGRRWSRLLNPEAAAMFSDYMPGISVTI